MAERAYGIACCQAEKEREEKKKCFLVYFSLSTSLKRDLRRPESGQGDPQAAEARRARGPGQAEGGRGSPTSRPGPTAGLTAAGGSRGPPAGPGARGRRNAAAGAGCGGPL